MRQRYWGSAHFAGKLPDSILSEVDAFVFSAVFLLAK
jgi:hypothetical protein